MGKSFFPLLLTLIILFGGSAGALSVISSCPYNITVPNELYVVVDDGSDGSADGILTCSSPGVGIAVSADNVTVDFNGTLVGARSGSPALEVANATLHVFITGMEAKIATPNPDILLKGYVTINNSNYWIGNTVLLAIQELHLSNGTHLYVRIGPFSPRICNATLEADNTSTPSFNVICDEENKSVNVSSTFTLLYRTSNMDLYDTTSEGSCLYVLDSRNVTIRDIQHVLRRFCYIATPSVNNSEDILITNVSQSSDNGGFVVANSRRVRVEHSTLLCPYTYNKPFVFSNVEELVVYNTTYASIYLQECSDVLLENATLDSTLSKAWDETHTPAFYIEGGRNITLRDVVLHRLLGIAVLTPPTICEISAQNTTYFGRELLTVKDGSVALAPPLPGQVLACRSRVVLENVSSPLELTAAYGFVEGYQSAVKVRNVKTGKNPSDQWGRGTGLGLSSLVRCEDCSVEVDNLTVDGFTYRAKHGYHSEGALFGSGNLSVGGLAGLDNYDGARPIPYITWWGDVVVENSSMEGNGTFVNVYDGEECHFRNVTMEGSRDTDFYSVNCARVELFNATIRGYMVDHYATARNPGATITATTLAVENVSFTDSYVEEGATNGYGERYGFFGIAPRDYSGTLEASLKNFYTNVPVAMKYMRRGISFELALDNTTINATRSPAFWISHLGVGRMTVNNSHLISHGRDASLSPFHGSSGLFHLYGCDGPYCSNGWLVEMSNTTVECESLAEGWFPSSSKPLIISATNTSFECTIRPYGELYSSDNTTPGDWVSALQITLTLRNGTWRGPVVVANNSTVGNATLARAVEGLHVLLEDITAPEGIALYGEGWLDAGSVRARHVWARWADLSSGDPAVVNITVLNDSFVEIEDFHVVADAGDVEGAVNLTFPLLNISREGSGPYTYTLVNPFSTGRASYVWDPGSKAYYVGVDEETGFVLSGGEVSMYTLLSCSEIRDVKGLPHYAPMDEVLSSGSSTPHSCSGGVVTITP